MRPFSTRLQLTVETGGAGVTLALHRRAAAVRRAADHRALLVEDDHDGEYRNDRQPVGALRFASLAGPGEYRLRPVFGPEDGVPTG